MIDEIVGLTFLGCVSLLTGFYVYECWRRWRQERWRTRWQQKVGWTTQRTAAEQRETEAQERTLLWRVLTPEQRDSVRRYGYIEVMAASGQRYRLYNGYRNVQELGPSGETVASLCIGQCQQTSPAGQLLAELLLLQTNEAAFRHTARRTALHGRGAFL